jgi:hypothetical protein
MLYFPVTSLCNYLKWIKLNKNIEALFLGSYLILGGISLLGTIDRRM